MPSSSNLENLAKIGQLKAEPPAQSEIDGLVASGRKRLKDAKNPANALESRFDLAYSAAHAFSLAALRARGYRSQNRYLVFQVLPHTLGMTDRQWGLLALCHERRNKIEYEGVGEIDEGLVAELVEVTEAVLQKLQTRKPPNFIAMACTTASVSYRESLTRDELVQALLGGQVPENRRAHFQVLLDETPIALLQGLLEQVGKQATYTKVLENFLRIGVELKSSRDLRSLLAPAGR